MQQSLLFFSPEEITQAPAVEAFDEKLANAIAAVAAVMLNNHCIVIGYSGGKDSSSCVVIVFLAALQLLKQGITPPHIVVLNADTKVDNPEVDMHIRGELTKMVAFAEKHGLKIIVRRSRPALNDEWAVKILSGRSLPGYPDTQRDCQEGLKGTPMGRLRKQVFQALQEFGYQKPVSISGTRFDESVVRARNMKKRNESDTEVVANVKTGDLFLSPIAKWREADVWELLNRCVSGDIDMYSDFDDLYRIYGDAGGGGCTYQAERSIVAKPCGARTGCWSCTPIGRDKSLENMIDGDERYAYMRGLNRLQRYLLAIQYDFSKRNWIHRTIRHGYIAFWPDTFSSQTLSDLLAMCLTLDVEEAEAAQCLGIRRRFQIISAQALFAIDAYWSVNGLQKPFHALHLYREIYLRGKRFPVPEVPTAPKVKMPEMRFIHVGADWDEGEDRLVTGLRDVFAEAMTEFSGSGCLGTRTLKGDGLKIMDIQTAPMFSIDMEAVEYLMEFELDYLLEKHHDQRVDPSTYGFMYYVGQELVKIHKGDERFFDTRLRRANFRLRKGLAGNYDHDYAYSLSVSAAEVPKETLELIEADLGKQIRQGGFELEFA